MLISPPIWPYPNLIAHRGGGRLAPENTLSAVRKGATHGFGMVEYDVKLSADDVPILLHDDTLQRTSDGAGRAMDFRYSELAQFDFGRWFSAEYAGEPVATLYSVAAFTQAHGVHSNIELKPCLGMETHTGERIARLASQLWAQASLPPLLSSFSEAALAAARDTAPQLPRALLFGEALPPDWLARATRLGCMGVNLNHEYVIPEVVQEIQEAGLTLAVWTVNEFERARQLLSWGCHAVITDELITLSPQHF